LNGFGSCAVYRREDVRRAAQDAVPADDRSDPLLVVDTVLQRQDRGPLPEQRRQPAGGRIGVVGLHEEEDEIDRTDRRRVVRRLDAAGGPLALGRHDRQAPLPDRVEMRAPRDQVDVGAAVLQPRAKVAADRAGAHDRDLHRTVGHGSEIRR